MKPTLRITEQLINKMRDDLRRAHEFAMERVGFLFCKIAMVGSNPIAFGYHYHPILDHQYIEDTAVGARFDSSSIREAMQFALQNEVCAFHVHLHEHRGIPTPSRTDIREMQALMPSFVNVRPNRVHGALVLSADSACARIWRVDGPPQGEPVERISIVGSPMLLINPYES